VQTASGIQSARRTSLTNENGHAGVLGLFFDGAFLLLLFAAWLGAGAPWGLAHGVLFCWAGGLMVARAPAARPAWWLIPGLGWLVGALFGFLPLGGGTGPDWWLQFVRLGLVAAWPAVPQPAEAAVVIASMAAAGLIAMWVLGMPHRPDARMVGAGLWVGAVITFSVADLWLRSFGQAAASWAEFGFFPNRNHSAVLIAMGIMVAFGLLVQSVRDRWLWLGGFCVLSILWLSGDLLLRSPSRAGVVFLLPALLLWFLLVGRRYLRGNSAWAAGLLILTAILAFAASESHVKKRLGETIGRIGSLPVGDGQSDNLAEIDGRVGIACDTMAMIAAKPWTGWGSGQFRFVFPQFRTATVGANESTAYHPESSWLWVAAESGVPAALCLLGLAVAVITAAARGIRRPGERQRALRAACLAAAAIPLLHGLVDVSVHRVGILWAGAALLALAMPTPRKSSGRGWRVAWRLGGCAVLGWGLVLLSGQLRGSPVLPSEHAAMLASRAHTAYLADHQSTTAAPEVFLPDDDMSEDLLEAALADLETAAGILPLEPRIHGLRGMIALHFDDKDDLARRSFEIQRQLDPIWLRLPLLQAHAWAPIDSAETHALWREAMRRAEMLDSRLPGKPWRELADKAIRQQAARFPHLAESVPQNHAVDSESPNEAD